MNLRSRVSRWCVPLLVIAVVVCVLVGLPASVSPTVSAQAASGSDFDAGNIIDDEIFYNSQAMDAGAVQNFLNGRVANCKAGYTCLKDYRQQTDSRPADRYCKGYTGQASESAAQIIDNVARSCGISQQVLLVLLEKEQSLVTSQAPSDRNYLSATGQGCPDTAPCDSSTQGFFYQVYYAARQYQIYRLTPWSWGYQAGRWNTILYHPDPARNCGTTRVFIANQATAGLYIYTPYTPNAAALNNLYGTGDNCSSYGNRNFWRLFTDWFGSTHVPSNPHGPFGSVDAVQAMPGSFQVSGWVADPDSSESIPVHVYVSGVGYPFLADGVRDDVGAALPNLGSRHGFSVTVPATAPGPNDVCVYGINVGAGGNSLIKCTRVESIVGSPTGRVESISAVPGGVAVSGWAFDPDTVSSIDLHVYVDSVGTAIKGDAVRDDVAAVYPMYGSRHGFGQTIPADPGQHTVCVYGINVGFGSNAQLGCAQLTVVAPADSGRVPIGVFEGISARGTSVSVSGWALDPDTTLPISVRVDARGASTVVVANSPRSDVGSAYPGYGPNHGWVSTIDLPAGTTDVCVTALNTGRGGDAALGCKSITVDLPDLRRAPIGVLEGVDVRGSTAIVSGWALDQDTVRPIPVHIYVNSRGAAYQADKTRADVGNVFPQQGPDHGFAETVALPQGSSTICVYAINNGDGGNSVIGCRQVTVTPNASPPFGNLEAINVGPGTVTVDGWAIDPDTTDPIAVHVYVDAIGSAHLANGYRQDVASAYPGRGDQHGFSITVPATSGAHTVCVYPINDGQGPNTLLGCRSVTVP